MIRKIFALALAAVLLASCGGASDDGKIDQPININGDWELTNVSTKSATIGNESISVYINFGASEFTLYQVIGDGLPRKYTGSYVIAGSVLSGSYSDGKSWGATYDINVNGNVLTMTKKGGTEVNTYKKATIPQEIISRAL